MAGWEPRSCFLEWSRTPENHPLSSQVLFPPWSKNLKSYFARQFLTGNVLCLFSFHFVLFTWGFCFTWVIGPSTPLCEEYATNTFSCRQKSQHTCGCRHCPHRLPHPAQLMTLMGWPFCNERGWANKALAPGDWLRLNRGCVQAFSAPRPTSFNHCTNWFRTLKPNCLFSAFIDSTPASKAGGLSQPLSHCSDWFSSVTWWPPCWEVPFFISFSCPWKVKQSAHTYKCRLSFLKRHNSLWSEFSAV